jgi:hypothetical protein
VSERYLPNPSVIETELPGELILLDPNTREMFSLNDTGTAAWRALPGRTLEQVGELLAASYEVEPAVASEDARRLVERLLVAGLLVPAPSPDDA